MYSREWGTFTCEHGGVDLLQPCPTIPPVDVPREDGEYEADNDTQWNDEIRALWTV